jgi:hypothetical protein
MLRNLDPSFVRWPGALFFKSLAVFLYLTLQAFSHTIPVGFGIIDEDLFPRLDVAGGYKEAFIAEDHIIAVVTQAFYPGDTGRIVGVAGLIPGCVKGVDAKFPPQVEEVVVLLPAGPAPVLLIADDLAPVFNDLCVFTDRTAGIKPFSGARKLRCLYDEGHGLKTFPKIRKAPGISPLTGKNSGGKERSRAETRHRDPGTTPAALTYNFLERRSGHAARTGDRLWPYPDD